MEDYLKGLIQALHTKIGAFVGHITELEMGIQAREQELKRLYEVYEPERLKEAQAQAGQVPASEEPKTVESK